MSESNEERDWKVFLWAMAIFVAVVGSAIKEIWRNQEDVRNEFYNFKFNYGRPNDLYNFSWDDCFCSKDPEEKKRFCESSSEEVSSK